MKKVIGPVAAIILIPLAWFLSLNLITGIRFNSVLLILITASIFFVIFLGYKLLSYNNLNEAKPSFLSRFSKRYYTISFLLLLILPLGGLFLNQPFSFIGDFSAPIFYIIAALNGMLFLLPPMENMKIRLLIFYLKSVGYVYILYFFIVFIPNLPFGIWGLLVMGLGIFVFAPTFATFWQGYSLIKEGITLSKSVNKLKLISILFLGFLTLPVALAANFFVDAKNFSIATKYVDGNNFNFEEQVNLTRLNRSLKILSAPVNNRRATDFSSGNIPIISTFYSHILLDGKVMSPESLLTLENIFFDNGKTLENPNASNSNVTRNTVRTADITTSTNFDEKEGFYRSWVNLKLENSSNSILAEYKTEFTLPEGAYISNYYLDVFGTKKEGILADRRAALSIYNKIINTRRDPGLLHYIGNNTLELKVFPFSQHQVRETGFEIIHTKKLDLTIDSKTVSLIGDDEQREINVCGAILVPASKKKILPSVTRTPKYYFVVDSSKNSNVQRHLAKIKDYTEKNNITEAQVILTSYKLKKYDLSTMMDAKYKAEGGFNLNSAVRMILTSNNSDTFPLIIAVSDNMPMAVLPKNIYAMNHKYPESSYYYSLDYDLSLIPYSYNNNKADSAVKKPIIDHILNYNGTYLINNDNSELIITNSLSDKFISTENKYMDAILLHGLQQKDWLNSKTTSLELIISSFKAKVLTPQTAFIVVETQQQEQDLLTLQEKLLNGDEDTSIVTLDEPSLMYLIIPFILLLVFRVYKKKQPFIKTKLLEDV